METNDFANIFAVTLTNGIGNVVGFILLIAFYLLVLTFILSVLIVFVHLFFLIVTDKKIIDLKSYVLMVGKNFLNIFCQGVFIIIAIYIVEKLTQINIDILDVKSNYQTLVNVSANFVEALPYILLMVFVLGFWYLMFSSIFEALKGGGKSEIDQNISENQESKRTDR